MGELARSEGRRSELEVSQLPEVAALATALTTLFNGLGIPQQRYAARVAMDKSTVSRYLNGRRVANQDFINRLFVELERHRGVSITEETRQRVQRLRMAALKISDPQSFEVENLREEVDKSHRAINQLRRQQEALELLLDQKEESAREAEQQLALLRGDWVAERVQSEAELLSLSGENQRNREEAESLRTEIADLRQQLADVNALRRDAEQRCTDLEERLAEAEQKLAESLDSRPERYFPYSPGEVAEEVFNAHREQRFNDAARMLSLAAAHFDGEETVALWQKMGRSRRGTVDAIRLLDDAIRFGSMETAASITESAINSTPSWWTTYITVQTLATSIASSKSTNELLDLYKRWSKGGPLYGVIRTALPLWSEDAPTDHVFRALKMFHRRNDSTIAVRVLHAYSTRPTNDVLALAVMYHDLAPKRFDEAQTLMRSWLTAYATSERPFQIREWNDLVKKARYADSLRFPRNYEP
jgi:transcriptional regulator with XRE-family HTH domain